MKPLRSWLAAAVLAAFLAGATACRREEPPPASGGLRAPGATPAAGDPEAENPDRGRWVDLRAIPFRPEWVGGTLVVIRRGPPETLNNLLWSSAEARPYVKHYLYPFLLQEIPDAVDGQIRVEPWAAESLPRRQGDDLTFQWRLREGLTWEDGRPVTAADYAFTWKLLQDPQVNAPARRAALERVAAVAALDDRTIEVRFKEPYYNSAVGFGLEFTVVPEHGVPHDPAAFSRDEAKRHLAFGPYRVAQQDLERLVFELRPEYRTRPHPVGPVYVERIEFRFNRDEANRRQQLRSGTAHVDTVSHDQFVELANDATFAASCWRTFYYLQNWVFCAWNLRAPGAAGPEERHPLFGDVRVRRAMSHLFPRERLRDEYYHGMATLVTGPWFFKDGDYDRGVEPVRFDPESAGRLLAAAGWTLGAGGVREKAGRPFRFALTTLQGAGWLQAAATQFVEAARRVGVEIEVRELPFPALVKALDTHDFDAVLSSNRMDPIEPDVYELFHSSQAALQGHNWSGVADARLDALIDAYRREPDPAKRRATRQMVHRVVDEIHPFTFLYSVASPVGVSRKWANVKVHDLGILFRDFVWRELWERHPPAPK